MGLALSLAPSAWAQTTDDSSRATARDLGTAGVDAFQRGDYEASVAKLEKAFKVLRVPSIGLWSARALEKSGKLVKASERYREVGLLEISSGQASIQRQAQADAASELAALTPRLPALVVQLDGAQQADLKVAIDGVSMAAELVGERRPVDPGKHIVEASQGGKTTRAEALLKEGDTKTVVLRFAAAPAAAAATPVSAAPAPTNAAPPATSAVPAAQAESNSQDPRPSSGIGTQRMAAIGVAGLGVAGIVVGSVFGLKARSKLVESNRTCTGKDCTDQAGVDLNNEAKSAATISTIGFIVGGVGLAGATALWVTGKPRDEAKTDVSLGWGSVLVKGTW